jgi:hypothetical protein
MADINPTRKPPDFSPFQAMEELIDHLRATLGRFSTGDVCVWMADGWLRSTTDALYMSREMGFSSQQRQSFYMIGVLMNTPEPDHPEDLDKAGQDYIVALLNEIEVRYFDPYLKKINPDNVTEHVVAFGSFLQFFMSGRLSYTQQIIDRMRDIDSKFDETVKAEIGISVADTMTALQWVLQKLSDGFADASDAWTTLHDAWQSFRTRSKSGNISVDELGKIGKDPALIDAGTRASGYFPMSFKASDMRKELPEIADAFLNAFGLKRGGANGVIYYAVAERNPAENAPFFFVDEDTVCCPFRTIVYETMESRIARILFGSKDRESYSDERASYLERRSMQLLGGLFPAGTLRLESYYETADSQFEHDGLLFFDGNLVLVESKSSDMREPSRTPDRAFERAKQHFKSDRGIQHGFDQAQRVVDLIQNATSPIHLYSKDGRVLAEIDPASVKNIFVVCTTMESFGPLATNLTYLLTKREDQQYPLAINLFDLETMVEGFRYKGLGSDDLTADDELDLAGTFIKRGNLPKPPAGRTVVTSGSDTFDDIYYQKMGVKRTGQTSTSALALRHIERLFKREQEIGATGPRKVGRNEGCPCGSGKKYKKCHGS